MLLTDYYKFEHKPNTKTRLDCVASSKSYNPLEVSTNSKGVIVIYIGDNTHTKAGQKGKSDISITTAKGKHLSSIYRPEIETNFGWGDVKDTTDALLFVFADFAISNGQLTDGAVVEIFVARGKRSDRQGLYNLLTDGELDGELETLRQNAQTTLY